MVKAIICEFAGWVGFISCGCVELFVVVYWLVVIVIRCGISGGFICWCFRFSVLRILCGWVGFAMDLASV